MLDPLEAERRAAGSRSLLLLGAVCVLSGCVVVAFYDIYHEHVSAYNRPSALTLYVPPAALRPMMVPGRQTIPAAPPSVMTPASSTRARMPAAPAAPVASPSVIKPMESSETQMPAAPAVPMVMMPAPVDSSGTHTGPQIFAGFFAGLASSFAIGFSIVAKRMYDGMKSNEDSARDLQLGMLPGRTGVHTMMAVDGASDARDIAVEKETQATEVSGVASQVSISRVAAPPRMGMFDFLAFGKAGASHILVSDNGYANKLKAEIESGKISFEEAAKIHSTCPSASKGGSLGTFGPGEMVGAFNDYCFDPDTPLNELGVVRTSFGAHIIKLTKKP